MRAATAGLHHVTGIAGRPQANIEFYVRLLGLRLVKRTVNYDDPQTYHFYFGGPLGQPGTVITFFPWAGAGPAVRGAGEALAVAYRVPSGQLEAWRKRLEDHRLPYTASSRFGEELLAFSDPDGTPLELIEAANDAPLMNWPGAPVDGSMALQGLHAVSVAAPNLSETVSLLVDTLGMTLSAEEVEAGVKRVRLSANSTAADATPGASSHLDLIEAPSRLPGRLGTGSLHHVALRAADGDLEGLREALQAAGLHPTPVKDRNYFKSVYFTEPGGAIFEVATDGPGFTADEPADELGLAFKLPTWLESEREFLRGRLPVTASPEYADRWSR